MKKNNGGENHADGPKETFRSRQHQWHPEANINLQNKQQDLDRGSNQSDFVALILEMSNDTTPLENGMCSIIPTKSYGCYGKDSHLDRIDTCIVAHLISSLTH